MKLSNLSGAAPRLPLPTINYQSECARPSLCHHWPFASNKIAIVFINRVLPARWHFECASRAQRKYSLVWRGARARTEPERATFMCRPIDAVNVLAIAVALMPSQSICNVCQFRIMLKLECVCQCVCGVWLFMWLCVHRGCRIAITCSSSIAIYVEDNIAARFKVKCEHRGKAICGLVGAYLA